MTSAGWDISCPTSAFGKKPILKASSTRSAASARSASVARAGTSKNEGSFNHTVLEAQLQEMLDCARDADEQALW